ncbi:MAG TPA: CopD family protein [Gaiellaceae bacterium]|nr:CopD family protein [Gaiellaceae bacterium]
MRRALLLGVVLALLAPNAALGHVILESSQPVTQSRLEAPPNEIRLRFNQAVTVSPGAIQVLAPDGLLLSGTTTVSEGGRVVTAPVSRIARGAGYTVRWRVLGGDGHAPAGVFTFGVGVAAPPPTEAVGASGATWRDDAARWALFVALALLIGPLVVRLLVVRGSVPARAERGFHLLGVVAAFLVIDVGIVAFVLRASNALQLPLGDLLYGDLQPFAEKTRFGVAFLAMTLGFGIVAAVLLLAWILDRPALRWPALLLSVTLASGLSLSGHQATEDNAGWLSQGADWLHLVAASVWAGGLVALAFLVWPLAPSLRRDAFLGFARLAVLLVGAMVLAGAYLALARLPEASDLWQTQYGRFLLLKLGIVAVALTWGAAHHFLVRPRLEAGQQPNVRPSLVGEAAVALTVLLAAAILTNAAPPPAEPPAANARSAR